MECLKKHIFYCLLCLQYGIFGAKVDSTTQNIYMSQAYQNTSDCMSKANPLECCKGLEGNAAGYCRAKYISNQYVTNKELQPFEYYAQQIDNLEDVKTELYDQKTKFCITEHGPLVTAKQEFECSPAGIAKFFEKNYFRPDILNGPAAKQGTKSTSPDLPDSFFFNCPGMFVYLCNKLGDECFDATGKYSIKYRDKKISFYDYVKTALKEGINPEPSNPPYYDWYTQQFPEEFYKYVVLPFVQNAQSGGAERGEMGAGFVSSFGGLTKTITDKSSIMWNTLNTKLQQKLKQDLPGGFALCSSNAGLLAEQLGCYIVLGGPNTQAGKTGLGTDCSGYPSTATNLYNHLRSCCACKKSGCASDGSGDMGPVGDTIMCQLMTMQYNIVNSLLKSQKAGFTQNAISGLVKDIMKGCNKKQKKTLAKCISKNFRTAVNQCKNVNQCTSQNDTSADCKSCVQAQLKVKCQGSKEVKQKLMECINSTEKNSEIAKNYQLLADAYTGIAEAQLQFAQFVKKYALNATLLPDPCKTNSNPNGMESASCKGDNIDDCPCLETKCLAFCDSGGNPTSGSINFKVFKDWKKFSQEYQKASSFITQMLHATYKKCPTGVSALSIFMDVLQIFGPVMMPLFVLGGGIAEIAMLAVMFVIQQVVSTIQTIFSDQHAANIEQVALEQMEFSVATGQDGSKKKSKASTTAKKALSGSGGSNGGSND